ncbi:MAG: ribonuclease D [Tepidisphaerales bacterium]
MSHDSAHADEPAPSEIPQHPLIPRGEPQLIATAEALQELLAHARAEGVFAYDSEFIGELSYHPRLCLVQVSTRSRIGLIDALAGLDLKPFWELIADPSLLKIVHAGEQDIEPVHRLIGRAAANVFDTQIAAGFIGLSYPAGLSKLVRELVGVQLGKGCTFTHWDQRPLSPVQLRYAADDVRYLPAVYDVIGRRLDELAHRAWAMEESASLCDPARYVLNPETDYLRVRGASSLTARGAAVLRELYQWREDAAMRGDAPPRSYLKDDILLDLARKPIRKVEDLDAIKGLPRPVELAEGQNILAVTQRALQIPQVQWPAVTMGDEHVSERFAADAMWSMVQAWCYGQSVDPSLVASRQEMGRWLRQVRCNGQDIPKATFLNGWRGELVGKRLVEMIRGRGSVRLNCPQGVVKSGDGEPTE